MNSPQGDDDEFFDAISDDIPRVNKPKILVTQPTDAQIEHQIKQLEGPNQAYDEQQDKVFVKDLDSGRVLDADVIHEDYRQNAPFINNPLSELIYQRTGLSNAVLDQASDDSGNEAAADLNITRSLGKTKTFLSNMKKKLTSKMKDRGGFSDADSYFDDTTSTGSRFVKVKAKHHRHKVFGRLVLVQELKDESQVKLGPIWAMEPNRDGRFLATGGQDAILRVWALSTEPSANLEIEKLLFQKKPYRSYIGHSADILDLSWSKNDFILSSSMDKTVRVWHISREDCLCVFQHTDYVTSISFHPKDDRFFLSGCLDCRLRLWNIPEKKVLYWNELPDIHSLITAVGFTNDGKTAIAGSYLGSCVFYEVEGLRYHTQVQVKSTRGKNSRGEKITGIEAMPNQPAGDEKVLITSNDSRLRVYNMRDKSLFCKYKGLTNKSSQIKASFSDDGKYIISGSEDYSTYIWNTFPDQLQAPAVKQVQSIKQENLIMTSFQALTTSRRDRNNRYESFEAHGSIVTSAIFGSQNMAQRLEAGGLLRSADDQLPLKESDGRLIITADYSGVIKLHVNERPSMSGTIQSNISAPPRSMLPGSLSSLAQSSSTASTSD